MIERRVTALEQHVGRMEQTLGRLEVMLVEIRANILNCATRKDLDDLRNEMSTARERIATTASKSDIEQLKDSVAISRGRLDAVPTTWQMLTFMVTSQVALAGILFVAIKFGFK